MTDATARLVVAIFEAHLALGLFAAAAIHAAGLKHLDPAAARGGLAFKALITPGLVALWPLVLVAWVRGPGGVESPVSPRSLRTAHRRLVLGLAVALPIVLAAALAARRPPPPEQPLPPALRAGARP